MELKDLKAGDEVAVHRGYYVLPDIEKIEKVTPSGVIVLKHNRRYTPTGRLKGAAGYSRSHLEVVTDELRNKRRHAYYCSKLSEQDWSKLDLDRLIQIALLLPPKETP